MALELFYTSVPRGLKLGSSGFCTVGVTSGMPAPMIQRLESLSGYRPVYKVGSTHADRNPTEYAHWRANIGGRFYSILSRVCFAGADYTRRSNKFAHHVVLESSELTPAGPAWVMMRPGVMESQWSGEPRVLPANKEIPSGANELRVCKRWAEATGDAGWAGVLAERVLLDATKPVYVLFEPGMELLPLIDEAIALLDERVRWRVTFSTFFSQLPAGLTCLWRCCAVGTPAAREAPAKATSGVLINLTSSMPPASKSRYVLMARTGQPVAEEKEPPPGGKMPSVPRFVSLPTRETKAAAPDLMASPVYNLLAEPQTAPRRATGPAFVAGDPYEQARRRREKRLWVAVIAGPILVICLAAIILRVSGINLTLSQTPAGSEAPAGELASAKKYIVQLEKESAELKGQAAKAREELARVQKELEQTREHLKDREGELNRLKDSTQPAVAAGGSDKPPSGATGPDEDGSTEVVRGSDRLPVGEEIDGIWVAELPKYADGMGIPGASQTPLIADLPEGARVTIELPRDRSSSEPQPFQTVEKGPQLIIKQKRPDSLERKDQSVELAKAEVDQGVLWWHWIKPPTDFRFQRGGAPALDGLVQTAVLVVRDAEGKEFRRVQLQRPKRFSFALFALQDLKSQPDSWKPHDLQLHEVSVPHPWTVDCDKLRPVCTISEPHGLKLQVSLLGDPDKRADDDKIYVGWIGNVEDVLTSSAQNKPERAFKSAEGKYNKALDEYAKAERKINKKIDAADKAIRNFEKRIAETEHRLGIPEKQSTIKELEDQRRETEKRRLKLERQVSRLEELRVKLQDKRKEEEEARKDHDEARADALRKEIRGLEEELTALEKREDGIREGIKNAQDETRTISEQIDDLKDQLEEARQDKTLEEWRDKAEEKKRAKTAEEEKLTEAERKRDDKIRELKLLNEQISSIRALSEPFRFHVVASQTGARLGIIEIHKDGTHR